MQPEKLERILDKGHWDLKVQGALNPEYMLLEQKRDTAHFGGDLCMWYFVVKDVIITMRWVVLLLYVQDILPRL
jgi:hypothetical protein